MPLSFRSILALAALTAVIGAGGAAFVADRAQSESSSVSGPIQRAAAAQEATGSLDLTDSQLSSVKVAPVETRQFPIEKHAVGSIQFNQEMSVDVFTPYAGRIIALYGSVGDDVKKGQTLFTIDSPDLLQAESTLIAAAGTLEFTTRNLARLKSLFVTHAVSQKDVEQAISDQQAAEGALRAGRNSVHLFGKTDQEIDNIIQRRMPDPVLVVPSPITGRITARSAAPGLYVQPGNAPAPFSVSDINTMWMVANVPEDEVPAFRVGQQLRVRVNAFPDRTFDGKISTIGASVDSNTRRVLVRSEVHDPEHELRAGMFATFTIETGSPISSAAVPLDGIVREGDGTMTVWVTSDRRRFTRRPVRIGLEYQGYRQILDGIQIGELVATEGALFLSNVAAAGTQ